MRVATHKLQDKVREERLMIPAKSRSGRYVWETWRAFAKRNNIPEHHIASLNRIWHGAEGVSSEKENEIRRYFDMDQLDPHLIYDAGKLKTIALVGPARPPRVSTSFNPEVYADFQAIRDLLDLSNDEFLLELLELHEEERLYVTGVTLT